MTNDLLERVCRDVLLLCSLNAEQRALLPGGKAPASVLRRVLEGELDKRGAFPFPLGEDKFIGQGGIIEKNGDGFLVHSQMEVSMGRYSNLDTETAPDLDSALRRYYQVIGGGYFNRVEIDWDS